MTTEACFEFDASETRFHVHYVVDKWMDLYAWEDGTWRRCMRYIAGVMRAANIDDHIDHAKTGPFETAYPGVLQRALRGFFAGESSAPLYGSPAETRMYHRAASLL